MSWCVSKSNIGWNKHSTWKSYTAYIINSNRIKRYNSKHTHFLLKTKHNLPELNSIQQKHRTKSLSTRTVIIVCHNIWHWCKEAYLVRKHLNGKKGTKQKYGELAKAGEATDWNRTMLRQKDKKDRDKF